MMMNSNSGFHKNNPAIEDKHVNTEKKSQLQQQEAQQEHHNAPCLVLRFGASDCKKLLLIDALKRLRYSR